MAKHPKKKREDDVRWIRKNKSGALGIVAHKQLPRYPFVVHGERFVRVKLVEVTQ